MTAALACSGPPTRSRSGQEYPLKRAPGDIFPLVHRFNPVTDIAYSGRQVRLVQGGDRPRPGAARIRALVDEGDFPLRSGPGVGPEEQPDRFEAGHVVDKGMHRADRPGVREIPLPQVLPPGFSGVIHGGKMVGGVVSRLAATMAFRSFSIIPNAALAAAVTWVSHISCPVQYQ